jgi:hypothetical protein
MDRNRASPFQDPHCFSRTTYYVNDLASRDNPKLKRNTEKVDNGAIRLKPLRAATWSPPLASGKGVCMLDMSGKHIFNAIR